MIEYLKLSPEERATEEVLDEAGLLHDMDKDHFRKKEDMMIGSCPDGRHIIRGVLEPLMSMYEKTHCLCLLPLLRYGGTLVLDDDSPLVQPGDSTARDFINDIKKAVKMGYRSLCQINHFSCAMGREHKIHPLHIVDSLAHAKERIKKREGISNITIVNLLQITDIEMERRRLSRIPFNDYIRWRKAQGNDIYDLINRKATKYR